MTRWKYALIACVTAWRAPAWFNHVDFDLRPVWEAGCAANHGVDPFRAVPLFLYPPGALLVARPIALIPWAWMCVGGCALGAATIIAATLLALRVADVDIDSTAALAVILAVLLCLPVRDALQVLNVDVFLVVLEVLALRCATTGRWAQYGALIGLSCAIKPILLPLLLIPLFARHWAALRSCALAASAVTVAGLLVTPNAAAFVRTTLPGILAGTRPEMRAYDMSIHGFARRVGISPIDGSLASLLIIALTVVTVWRGARLEVGPVEQSGVLLAGFIVSAPFAWGHYAILLLPAAAMFASDQSTLRSPLGWAAFALIAGPNLGPQYARMEVTIGLIGLVAAACVRWRPGLLLGVERALDADERVGAGRNSHVSVS